MQTGHTSPKDPMPARGEEDGARVWQDEGEAEQGWSVIVNNKEQALHYLALNEMMSFDEMSVELLWPYSKNYLKIAEWPHAYDE